MRVTDTTAPRVDLPLPPGWADAGPNTPEWSLGAIIYSTPTDPANPPNIIAVMSKLTGNVDPAKIVEYAPGSAFPSHAHPGGEEIFVDEDVRVKAMVPLQRMLDFSAELKRARGV